MEHSYHCCLCLIYTNCFDFALIMAIGGLVDWLSDWWFD